MDAGSSGLSVSLHHREWVAGIQEAGVEIAAAKSHGRAIQDIDGRDHPKSAALAGPVFVQAC
jgi:hypothetical protein